MITAGLIFGLIGLALLDSLNTTTLVLTVVILVAAKRPLVSGWLYAIGAIVTFFVFANLLYFGLDAAQGAVDEAATWLRRFVFALATLFFVYLAIGRLKDRPRKPVSLPSWFTPRLAFFLGAIATVGDIPNAFPLVIAVENLVNASVEPLSAILLLSGYTLIYALPALLLLTLATAMKNKVFDKLNRIKVRFTTGTVRKSKLFVSIYALLAIICMAVAFLL